MLGMRGASIFQWGRDHVAVLLCYERDTMDVWVYSASEEAIKKAVSKEEMGSKQLPDSLSH